MRLSVIIPTCGRANYLRRALLSIDRVYLTLDHSFDDLDVIVIDDAHEDECRLIIDDLNNRLPFAIDYQRSRRGPLAGPSDCRDQGIKAATSDIVYLLDDDDQFLPNRFLQSLPILRKGEADAVLERSLRCYDDGSGRPPYITGPYETTLSPFEFLIVGGEASHITPGATAFNKSLYLASGGYDPRLHYGEDLELLLRLCLHGRVTMLAGDPVCRISIHPSNTSRPENLDYWQNMFSLGTLLKKVRRGRERWPQTYRFLRDGGVVSGKLDFCLSQVRLESKSAAERLRRGLRVIRYFPLDCLRLNNLKTIGVWLTRGA